MLGLALLDDLVELLLAPGPDGAIVLRTPESRHELDQMLGVPAGNVRLVLVEDETARTMVEELWGRYTGISSRSVRVVITKGASALEATCRGFPASEALSLVGILDGDRALPGDARWPVLGLPGPENPDALLRRSASADLDAFAAALGRGATLVRTAVSSLTGIDEHDWFVELATALSIRSRDVVRAAFSVLLEDPQLDSQMSRPRRGNHSFFGGRTGKVVGGCNVLCRVEPAACGCRPMATPGWHRRS